ncbi:MAG: hypothetical protein LC722_04890 [Actinobacteria bacterium]|nr:hypothetical protein [Actinomycetota bacterium]
MAVKAHDPERAAAEYLGGQLSARRRRTFEAHVIDCEDCWREVDVARRGRSIAEGARELAPQPLRERVRAAVFSLPAPRRRWLRAPAVVAVVAVVTVVGVFLAVRTPDQPRVIDAAIAAGSGEMVLARARDPVLPRRLGDLVLVDARSGSVDGLPVTQHVYRDAAGHVVSVLQAPRAFPVAAGAVHAPDGRTWTVEIGKVVLFCADRPKPSLVAGDDEAEVRLLVGLLGLR